MAKQIIDVGTTADDGTGDRLRDAFIKVNENFTELYTFDSNISTGIALTDISVTTGSATGAGALAYNNSTGVFTFQPAVLPSALTDLGISDGTNGQVLTTNGSGTFTFEDGGGIGLSSRTTGANTSPSIADAASADINIPGFKGYVLMKIQTDKAAWVRVYTDDASRTADASRTETTDPAVDSGVIAEVITTGAQTVSMAPATIGYNNESSPTTTIPIAVTNKSGSTGTVTVTLTILQLEA